MICLIPRSWLVTAAAAAAAAGCPVAAAAVALGVAVLEFGDATVTLVSAAWSLLPTLRERAGDRK